MTQLPQYKEEIDFRELVRSPRKLFGFSYIFFFKMFVVVGILYVWNLNDLSKNSYTPLVLEDSSAFVRDIPMQSPSVLPPVDVRQVAAPTPQLLSHGRDLYKANCASCHGDNGLGDGPAGLVLNPKPRNFHQVGGWTNGAKVSEIYKTLQEGIIRNGMASYSHLPPADRFALIHAVRSFHPAPPADTEQEIAGLETTYQLSKGRIVSAQIPVRDAIRRLAAEAQPGRDSVARELTALRTRLSDPGGRLFVRYIADPERLLTACRARRDLIATPEGFTRLVAGDPVAVGARPGIASLPPDGWALLHGFVLEGVR